MDSTSKDYSLDVGGIVYYRRRMNELLSWGLPIGAVLAFIGLGFGVLQIVTSTEEFWISRGFFVLAAIAAIVRIVIWGLLTSRSLTLRLIVSIFACGIILGLAIEAVRYVNRKSDRWIKSHQVQTESLPLATTDKPLSEAQQTQTGEIQKAEPNLLCLSVDTVPAHMNKYGEIIEGELPARYIKKHDNFHAIIARYGNQPVPQRSIGGIGYVSAQLTYQSPKTRRPPVLITRGSWLSEPDSRIAFGVNDTHFLVLANVRRIEDQDPQLTAAQKVYSGSLKGWKTKETYLIGDEINVKVQLISESDGAILRETEFRIKTSSHLKGYVGVEFNTEHLS